MQFATLAERVSFQQVGNQSTVLSSEIFRIVSSLRPSDLLSFAPRLIEVGADALGENPLLFLDELRVDSDDDVRDEALLPALVEALQSVQVPEHHCRTPSCPRLQEASLFALKQLKL